MESEFWSWLYRKTFYARGAVTAVTFVAVLDGFLGWGRVGFLAFAHAIITHWNRLLNGVVQRIHELIPVVPVPHTSVLYLTVIAFAGAPLLSFSIEKDEDGRVVMTKTDRVGYAMLVAVLPFAFWFAPLTAPAKVVIDWMSIAFMVGFSLLTAAAVGFRRRGVNQAVGVGYGYGLFFGFVFLVALELLYQIPFIAERAQVFVDSANT